jgi:hypothetical protein
MDRIRDRMGRENEKRRELRLTISDIQLNAAMRALLDGDGKAVDITRFHPQVLRAVNDTIRLAGDTQRLDSGQATARLGQEDEQGITDQRIRIVSDDARSEIARFIGVIDEVEDDGTVRTRLPTATRAIKMDEDDAGAIDNQGESDPPEVEFA